MPLVEALAAAALVAALLYVVDRGMAFHICLYAAIASGKRFTGEEAYRATENPFFRGPRLFLWAVITAAFFVVAHRGSLSADWVTVAAISAVALVFVAVSAAYAFKAFRRTRYGVPYADAIEQRR
jgi:drug/metabolite transporter (DMT)-like permease